MADERIVLAVKIVDAATNQEAAVTAADGLEVDTELPAAAALADDTANPTVPGVGAFLMVFDGTTWDRAPGTAADGLQVDTELPAAAALTDNFANPTAPAVGSFGMLWDGATWDRAIGDSVLGATVNTELPAAAALADATANPTAPAVGSFGHVWNGATWDRMTGNTADGVDVDTELPAAAALADDTANPTVPGVGAFLMGFDSGAVNWNRVEVDDAGHLQVDVLTGGGSDTPTNPTVDLANSTDTAAGSSSNLDSAEITEAEFLWQVDLSASVGWKAIIQKVENAVADPITTLFGRAGESVIWKPPHRNFAAHAGAAAGLDVFRAVMTNLDTSQAADLYATFYYST